MAMATAAHPAKEYIYERPWMYPKQEAAFFSLERYAICEASTKAGKTVACMAWIAEQALLCPVPGRNFWWVAPTQGVSKIAFSRLKLGLPRDIYKANETERTLTLINGSVIWFKGADKPDTLYGEDVYAAVIDEATRCKEAAWYAVRSTLTATRGPVRIIGNVKGRRNWAYTLARQAEGGARGMRYTKITALDAVAAGVLAQAEIDDARATLPDAVFRELYLAEPADDGGNPFGLAAIAAAIAPLSADAPAAWGIDLAKSHDWTVCIALDRAGFVCRYDRWQSPWQETIARIDALVGTVPALVDSTGVGDPILEALQRPYERHLAQGRTVRENGRDNYEGFKYSSPSKQQLMEGLAAAIQQRSVHYPDAALLPGCVIVSELEEFEYAYTAHGVRYTAPEGQWDDAVNALALARRKLSEPVSVVTGWSPGIAATGGWNSGAAKRR